MRQIVAAIILTWLVIALIGSQTAGCVMTDTATSVSMYATWGISVLVWFLAYRRISATLAARMPENPATPLRPDVGQASAVVVSLVVGMTAWMLLLSITRLGACG